MTNPGFSITYCQLKPLQSKAISAKWESEAKNTYCAAIGQVKTDHNLLENQKTHMIFVEYMKFQVITRLIISLEDLDIFYTVT